MAPKQEGHHQSRLAITTKLSKALELIASDRIKDDSKKYTRWNYRVNTEAARILLSIVGPDANLGWSVLHNCDYLGLYGSEIPLVFKFYFQENTEQFILQIMSRDRNITKWLDKQKQLKQ